MPIFFNICRFWCPIVEVIVLEITEMTFFLFRKLLSSEPSIRRDQHKHLRKSETNRLFTFSNFLPTRHKHLKESLFTFSKPYILYTISQTYRHQTHPVRSLLSFWIRCSEIITFWLLQIVRI